jgi:acyl-CoA thioester hydrolase
MKPNANDTRVEAPPAALLPLFHWPLRVYWEDTDAGGIVFYANHLKFFERARTEWLRSLGVQQQALREAEAAVFVVSDTAVRYLAPARLDDELQISVALLERGAASMRFVQQSRAAGVLLAEGHIRIGCVDAGTLRPRRIPRQVHDAIERSLKPALTPELT